MVLRLLLAVKIRAPMVFLDGLFLKHPKPGSRYGPKPGNARSRISFIPILPMKRSGVTVNGRIPYGFSRSVIPGSISTKKYPCHIR
jgi:hypothetical protein